MATVSSAGIGSGLDVNSIVTQLMAIEKQPLTALQTKAGTIQSTVSEYGKIKSAVSTLNDLASKLGGASAWNETTASSSSTSVSGTTKGGSPGTYTVAVQSLASVQTLATPRFADSTALTGAGTLHIELGTWSVGQASFTPKAGATAVDVALTATDTLATARDKINAAGGGVTALIMTDASGSRLLLRSNDSGAANGFATSGVSSLAYDSATRQSSSMTLSQTAADAQATVNGLPVTSTTNSFASIVDGLTLNVASVTTDPAIVTVATDTTALKKTLTDFAAAYTAVVKLIANDTKYDAASKKSGILQGDSAAVGLQRQLRAIAGTASSASSTFSRLSDAGLEIQADGSMTVNDTKATNALANLGELKKLFSNSSLTDPTADGFGKRFRVTTDAMLGIEGSLTTRSDGLAAQLDRNRKAQDALSTRLTGIEARLRAQYTALDTKMASLTTQSSYITQQIAAWNGNKN